jgi:hypothetical protein
VGRLKTVERTEHYVVEFDSGNTLHVTNDHPMWSHKGWASIMPAATTGNKLYDRLDKVLPLLVGTGVLNEFGKYDTITSIIAIDGNVTTYTLGEVLPAKNFYADGFLASNYAC